MQAQRRDIFKKLVLAEDRADAEAWRRYPNDAAKYGELLNKLTKANKEALAREAGLSQDQLSEIGIEGIKKNWPMPKPPGR